MLDRLLLLLCWSCGVLAGRRHRRFRLNEEHQQGVEKKRLRSRCVQNRLDCGLRCVDAHECNRLPCLRSFLFQRGPCGRTNRIVRILCLSDGIQRQWILTESPLWLDFRAGQIYVAASVIKMSTICYWMEFSWFFVVWGSYRWWLNGVKPSREFNDRDSFSQKFSVSESGRE